MYVRVSLRGMLRLIRVDTLRRVHNVGFLAGRLICNFLTQYLNCFPKINTICIHRRRSNMTVLQKCLFGQIVTKCQFRAKWDGSYIKYASITLYRNQQFDEAFSLSNISPEYV